jgi:hypothetical protein
MPPKTDTTEILAQLAIITNKLSKLDTLEAALNKMSEENTILKAKVESRDAEINILKNRLNHVEQHHRSWSLRVFNLPIPAADESSPRKVMDTVYKELIVPILEGARSKGAISTIPPVHHILENAHTLAGKAGSPKPLIVRFHNQYERDLLFHFKREFAPREEADLSGSASTRSQGAAASRPARLRFPFCEDLTRDNFAKMRELARDPRVAGCWSVGGQLRFKKATSPDVVMRVKDVYDSIDTILA